MPTQKHEPSPGDLASTFLPLRINTQVPIEAMGDVLSLCATFSQTACTPVGSIVMCLGVRRSEVKTARGPARAAHYLWAVRVNGVLKVCMVPPQALIAVAVVHSSVSSDESA